MNPTVMNVLQLVIPAAMAGLSAWFATQQSIDNLEMRMIAAEKQVTESAVSDDEILERLVKVEGEDRIINLKIEYLEGRIDNIIITRISDKNHAQ